MRSLLISYLENYDLDKISGLNPHGLLPCYLRFAPTSRPVNGKTHY